MLKKNKKNYDKLEESTYSLQKAFSKFLVIQQNLIDAQRRIDHDLLRSDVIQEYSKNVLYCFDLQNFYKDTVNTMIKAFDIDCSALFMYQHKKDRFVMVESSGIIIESKTISSDWITRYPGMTKELTLLLTNETIHKSHFNDLGLHHAVIALVFDKFNSINGVLLGGISVQNQPFYDPITKDHIPAFKVFTQQVQLCLHNIKAKQFIQKVIDKDPNLIYVTNVAQQIVMVNASVEKYLNLDKNTILNKSKNYIYNFFADPEYHSCVDEDVITNQKERTYEQKVILRSSGAVHWLQTTKIPIISDDEPDCVLTISVDITLHKQTTEELIKAQKSKELFLANMSHEIRTPLNAILGFSYLLSEGNLLPKQKKYLNHISTASNNLLTIINDILDISAIQAGKLILANESFNINNNLLSISDSLALNAKKNGIDFRINIDHALNCSVLGDPVRLGQILTNIVGNAIKFTDDGYVCFDCTIDSMSVEEIIVKFTVTDTGIGIDESKLDIIFETFSQVDPSSVRKYKGTGLGLAISKQLVELMNGQIDVKSKPGEGSQFDIRIPFQLTKKRCSIDKANNGITNKSCKRFQDLTILIAEDNKTNLEVITAIIRSWHIKYGIAVNGKEVVNQMSNHYDAILMDIQMPVMDGITATKIIRNDLNSTIPIVAVTANAIKGDKERYLQSGMNYYISKPISMAKLEKILIDIIKKKES